MIIIGYRPNFEKYCGRGCNCREGGMDSALWFDVASNAEEAAEAIASRMKESRDANHLFVIAKDGSPLQHLRSMETYSEAGEHSIWVSQTKNLESWEEDTEGQELQAEIRRLVSSKLEALKEREKQKAEAQRLKQEADRKKYTEQQELAKLAQLKAKYEAPASAPDDADGPEPK